MHFTKREETIQETASGNALSIDVFEFFNNKESKETFYVQSGIHGTELIGTVVIYQLMKYIQEHQPQINIICVPICNPFSTDSQIMGLQTGYNNIHTNTMNCLNYNRLGPNCSSKFEAQIAGKLFSLSQEATVTIDLHCSGVESMAYLYCHETLRDEARKFGIPYIVCWTDEEGSNAFEDQSFLLGKRAFTLELGPSRKIEKSDVERGLHYMTQFLFDSKDQEVEYRHNDNLVYLYSPVSGFLIWNISIGQRVHTGMEIATIYTRKGEVPLISSVDGIFLVKDNIHAPYQQQELGIILTD